MIPGALNSYSPIPRLRRFLLPYSSSTHLMMQGRDARRIRCEDGAARKEESICQMTLPCSVKLHFESRRTSITYNVAVFVTDCSVLFCCLYSLFCLYIHPYCSLLSVCGHTVHSPSILYFHVYRLFIDSTYCTVCIE